jgi:hypothetical protein
MIQSNGKHAIIESHIYMYMDSRDERHKDKNNSAKISTEYDGKITKEANHISNKNTIVSANC